MAFRVCRSWMATHFFKTMQPCSVFKVISGWWLYICFLTLGSHEYETNVGMCIVYTGTSIITDGHICYAQNWFNANICICCTYEYLCCANGKALLFGRWIAIFKHLNKNRRHPYHTYIIELKFKRIFAKNFFERRKQDLINHKKFLIKRRQCTDVVRILGGSLVVCSCSFCSLQK